MTQHPIRLKRMYRTKWQLRPGMLFAKTNYKLSPTAGRDGAVSIQVKTVLPTGAGLNPAYKRMIDPAGHFYAQQMESPGVLEASNRAMKSCGRIELTVRIEELRARVPFLVILNLSVDCLPGLSFFDHQV